VSNTDPTQWIKATASSSDGECVEMRQHEGSVEVRDTKDRGHGPTLSFAKSEFSAWLEGAKNGEFDHMI
jgi:hypothetical protein